MAIPPMNTVMCCAEIICSYRAKQINFSLLPALQSVWIIWNLEFFLLTLIAKFCPRVASLWVDLRKKTKLKFLAMWPPRVRTVMRPIVNKYNQTSCCLKTLGNC